MKKSYGTALKRGGFPDFVIGAASMQMDKEILTYLAKNSLSFRFAVRFFPVEKAMEIARIYTFCRITDDLVDNSNVQDRTKLNELLRKFEAICHQAYLGSTSGYDLIDNVMHNMANKSISFTYVKELIKGVGMDVNPKNYQDMNQLFIYTYRVAGVLGKWLTEIAGIKDKEVLERAADLGHAMQLTNIARDVGEDLAQDRIYIPQNLMQKYDLCEADLLLMKSSGNISPSYSNLMEEMLEIADWRYSRALSALNSLPESFRTPIGVAAYTYQSIHHSIRSNKYDNLNKRAKSTRLMKLVAARRAKQFLNSQKSFRLNPSQSHYFCEAALLNGKPKYQMAGTSI